jgi:ferredoxin
MSVKKLSENALMNFVEGILTTDKVEGVQAKGDYFEFAPLKSAKDLRLDYDVTILSPKKYLQPPVETMMTYEADGSFKSQFDEEKLVLLGVHPYDAIAIDQMDRIFSQDNFDTHYMKRRYNTTIIACDVVTPSKNVFASSMGTAVADKGYDILLTKIGDDYLADAATEKGQALLAKATNAVDATDADIKARQQVWDKNKEALNNHKLNCKPSELSALLEKSYDHPIWQENAEICFSCGSCNQVCPTCYCFNVSDSINWDMATGTRDRAWDSCMLDGFSKVAGDHEFRAKRADRLRHRFYRKGKYVAAKLDGEVACVGCGRCVAACLTDIANPVNVYNKLLG